MTFPIKQSRPAEKHKQATPVDSNTHTQRKANRATRNEAHAARRLRTLPAGRFFPSHAVSHLPLVLYGKAYAIRHPNHILPSGGTVQIAFREHSTVRAHHTWSCIAQYNLFSLSGGKKDPLLIPFETDVGTGKITPAAFLHNHLWRNNWKHTDYHGSFKTS